MTSIGILQILVFFGLILLVTKPVGLFMSRLFQGERTFLHPVLRPIEALVYKLCGVREDQEQRWTQYAASLLSFSLFSFLFVYALQRLQGLPAAQSAGVRSRPGASRPGVQHRHQLHDEHELAGVQRRIDDELPRPDGRAGRAELRLRGRRHRGGHRADSRLCAAGDRPDRELLGRPDPRDALRADSDRPRRGPRLLLAGRHPELPSVHRRQDGRRRDADHRAGARRVAGSHQAARHERRRLLQRQLGAPLRESDAAHEPRADPADLRARRRAHLYVRPHGQGHAAGLGAVRRDGADVPGRASSSPTRPSRRAIRSWRGWAWRARRRPRSRAGTWRARKPASGLPGRRCSRR